MIFNFSTGFLSFCCLFNSTYAYNPAPVINAANDRIFNEAVISLVDQGHTSLEGATRSSYLSNREQIIVNNEIDRATTRNAVQRISDDKDGVFWTVFMIVLAMICVICLIVDYTKTS